MYFTYRWGVGRCRTRSLPLLGLCALFLLGSGCSLQIPNGVFACAVDADCPPSFYCHADQNICFDSPYVCTPQRSCDGEVYQCGFTDDGCNNQLNCGECDGAKSCGGGGNPFRCECAPTTCAASGAKCGFLPSGCEDDTFLNCGGEESCRALGDSFVCGASYECECRPTPVDCADRCGEIWNGCKIVSCGGCADGLDCNADNRCELGECIPEQTSCDARQECGRFTNNCGDVITCGSNGGECSPGFKCTDFRCECVPRSCAQIGQSCGGPYDDGCGGEIACGSCDGVASCADWNADGENTCGGCSCADLGYECSDGSEDICGEQRSCGVCNTDTERCVDHSCVCEDRYDETSNNDELPVATPLGALSSGDVERRARASVGGVDQSDWYSLNINQNATTIVVQLDTTMSPKPALEVLQTCARRRCIKGTEISDAGMTGCEADDSGQVEMSIKCKGKPTHRVTLHVYQNAPTSECLLYELHVRANRTGITD